MPENVWMWFYCTLLIPKNCLPITFKHILLVYKNWIMWWRHICSEGQRSLHWPTQTHICFYGTRVFPLREQLADTPRLLQRRAERRYEWSWWDIPQKCSFSPSVCEMYRFMFIHHCFFAVTSHCEVNADMLYNMAIEQWHHVCLD